eukprot:TRINITY_DN25201_c0_g1_i1.p1 TRINITY_DN25201_c0_g1~~TRINITY_DN25201_c0_g1_i1.p1  ORF type:complete len:168 (-),score=30.44 TRINITY_DN25201_c0_g1_i1:31-534(-)
MHGVREAWLADPIHFTLDPWTDPWKEHGISDLSELREHHEQELQSLRERLRATEKERDDLAGNGDLQKLREELARARNAETAAMAELESSSRRELSATAELQRLQLGMSKAQGLRKEMQVEADYLGAQSISRCLELSRNNKTMLDSLMFEQSQSRSLCTQSKQPYSS